VEKPKEKPKPEGEEGSGGPPEKDDFPDVKP
jgi:hypothetical protein